MADGKGLGRKVSESPTDLRIILLGRSGSEKTTVGNNILDIDAFYQDLEYKRCLKASHPVEGRLITVINTPDLLNISHDKLSEELSWIKTLSEPGPHVFLLVLQPELFTEEERNRIRNILDNLSDRSLDYSMVLTTDGDQRGQRQENQALNLMIKECRGRPCLVNLSDLPSTSTSSETAAPAQAEDDTSPPSSSSSITTTTKGLRRNNSTDFLPPYMSDLRVVLLGRSVFGKRVENIILDPNAFHLHLVYNQASHPVKRRQIAVINTPDLLDPHISDDKLSEELNLIKTLSEPGPHVFLLVLQPELFTEERNRIKNILNKLSDRSLDYSMVLTTHEEKEEHSHGNQALNLMIQECRGRPCLVNLSDHNHLMTRIDQMVTDNGGGYVTCD